MIKLREQLDCLYPHQPLRIYIMGEQLEFSVDTMLLKENYPQYLDYLVRTVEVYRDDFGSYKDIIRILISLR